MTTYYRLVTNGMEKHPNHYQDFETAMWGAGSTQRALAGRFVMWIWIASFLDVKGLKMVALKRSLRWKLLWQARIDEIPFCHPNVVVETWEWQEGAELYIPFDELDRRLKAENA